MGILWRSCAIMKRCILLIYIYQKIQKMHFQFDKSMNQLYFFCVANLLQCNDNDLSRSTKRRFIISTMCIICSLFNYTFFAQKSYRAISFWLQWLILLLKSCHVRRSLKEAALQAWKTREAKARRKNSDSFDGHSPLQRARAFCKESMEGHNIGKETDSFVSFLAPSNFTDVVFTHPVSFYLRLIRKHMREACNRCLVITVGQLQLGQLELLS